MKKEYRKKGKTSELYRILIGRIRKHLIEKRYQILSTRRRIHEHIEPIS